MSDGVQVAFCAYLMISGAAVWVYNKIKEKSVTLQTVEVIGGFIWLCFVLDRVFK